MTSGQIGGNMDTEKLLNDPLYAQQRLQAQGEVQRVLRGGFWLTASPFFALRIGGPETEEDTEMTKTDRTRV